MEQATIVHMGETRRRWYVHDTDGFRYVTWAPTEADALAKMQKAGRFGPDVTVETVRITPAPPMGTD